jgi:hypothetical protein
MGTVAHDEVREDHPSPEVAVDVTLMVVVVVPSIGLERVQLCGLEGEVVSRMTKCCLGHSLDCDKDHCEEMHAPEMFVNNAA